MTTALAPIDTNADREQVELVKQTVARGCTDTELQLFLYTAKRTGLDPLLRQIHAVKRWDSNLGREAMAIQTGIDGYRLVADRTKQYTPGQRPTYLYKKDGSLNSAVAYVKKKTEDGEWHVIEAEAFWDEYVGLKKDGKPNTMWATKPHIMLAKCAEALALRKAFPAELSGLYTHEEMDQAGNAAKDKPAQGSLRDRVIKQVVVQGKPTPISDGDHSALAETIDACTTTPLEAPPLLSSEPEYDWQVGLVTKIEKAPKLTAKGQPFGTITLETIDGKEVTATWFGFHEPWTYETIREQLCGRTIEVEFVLTPASNPRYKPTLEHFRCSEEPAQ